MQAQAPYLGKDMVLIHMLAATPDEMKLVAASGASISASPGSELRIGYGLTKAGEFMDAGINVCVSVDTAPLTGNCHMFGILKLLRNAENAKALSEFKLSTRRALRMGTIDGARALGIDDKVGSLTPGKRADLIMIQTNVITMGMFTDPTRVGRRSRGAVERRHGRRRRTDPEARRQVHRARPGADRRRRHRHSRHASQTIELRARMTKHWLGIAVAGVLMMSGAGAGSPLRRRTIRRHADDRDR